MLCVQVGVVGVDYCIYRIRSVLGDNALTPRYVETLPRKGYRFIAPVTRDTPFTEPTIAVLPFANLNGNTDQDYFADGVTDVLITELARIPSIRGISRQSVLHLKGSRMRLDEIARDLRVDGVVEGAVLHDGPRARLTAQLVLIEPERHAWAQSYDCDVSAVLSTQRDVARAIAGCVAAALKPTGAAGAPRITEAPVTPKVAEMFLAARIEFEKMSADGIAKALALFREINPEPLMPNQYAAWMYLQVGEYVRAEAQARHTIARFPDSLQPSLVLGWSTWYQGRAAEAVAAFEQALRRSREALSIAYLGHVYARSGRDAEAGGLLHELEQLRARGQAPPVAFAVLHAGRGEIDTAFAWLDTAYRIRDGSLFWIAGAPGLDPLHSDARFADLVRRVGVSAA